MNFQKIIRTTIIISIVIYIVGIIYTVAFKYISIGDLIKASFTGFCMGFINVTYEVWFKDPTKRFNLKVKELIKNEPHKE